MVQGKMRKWASTL